MEQPKPASQMRTTQHRKRRLLDLEDHRKSFKKTVRIKRQNDEWVKLEAEGKVVRAWYRKKKKKE